MNARLAHAVGIFVAAIFLVVGAVSASVKFDAEELLAERNRMIKVQIEGRGVKESRVLEAIRQVPRHLFVPEDVRKLAHTDSALPIGFNQTISQPYIVGFMTEAAKLKRTDRVLEIGTGSGYQAAVLAQLVKEVYTIEIIEQLGLRAKATLNQLKYKNVHVLVGDGFKGWPKEAPFDVIFVTAAPNDVPKPLVEQLRMGGRFILPVGEARQHLIRVTKTESGLKEESLLPVSFLPMTGIAADK